MQRTREVEFRHALRELRTAIDHYKDAADQGTIAATELKLGNEGYPPTLAVLVEGVRAAGDATERKLKFLRRVPIDPMTGTKEWGMRSYQDEAGRPHLGRAERLRRVHHERRNGARRHEVQGLVASLRDPPPAAPLPQWRARLHADRAAGRHLADRPPCEHRPGDVPEQRAAWARGRAEGRPVPDARRHRPALRRQGKVSGEPGRSGVCRVSPQGASRSDDRNRPKPGRPCRRSRTRRTSPWSPGSTTSTAGRKGRRWTGPNSASGSAGGNRQTGSSSGGTTGGSMTLITST